MREQVDIEQLVQWAYRVQCVDRRAHRSRPRGPGSYPSTSPFSQFADLGTRVDVSGPVPFDITAVKVDDAMLVHDAVLRLPDCWLEWRAADEVNLWTQNGASEAGLVIEKQGGDWMAFGIVSHGEESCVLHGLQHVSPTVLIVTHARQGLRPEVYEEWVAPVGRRAAPGATDARGRKRKTVDASAEMFEVMLARALYMVWRSALGDLAVSLAGQLSRFDVVAPHAPAEPWKLSAKRVVPSLQRQNVG